MFNTFFNNISVISWQSVLLMEETGIPRENHWPVASHWQALSHIMLYWVHLTWAESLLNIVYCKAYDQKRKDWKILKFVNAYFFLYLYKMWILFCWWIIAFIVMIFRLFKKLWIRHRKEEHVLLLHTDSRQSKMQIK